MNLGLKASDEIFNLTVESRFFEYSIFLNSRFFELILLPFTNLKFKNLVTNIPAFSQKHATSPGRCFSFNRGRISLVGRAQDCRAGGRGFKSGAGPISTRGLKITKK